MTTTTTSEQMAAAIRAANRVAQEVRLQARTGYRYTVEMLKALRDGGDYNAIDRAIDVCDLIDDIEDVVQARRVSEFLAMLLAQQLAARVGVDQAIAQVQAAVQLADDPQRWLDAVWPKGKP